MMQKSVNGKLIGAVAILSAMAISTLACNINAVLNPNQGEGNGAVQAVEDSPQPPAEAQATDVPPTDAPDISYEGVSFSYDEAIAQFVNVETIAAVTDGEGPSWAVAPEHYRFSFVDYALADRFHEARILIYPTAEFEAANPQAANVVAALKAVLQSKPTSTAENLPFLPIWNAGALIQTNLGYVDFPGGSGVRYLTQHGQAYWPINNHDLFYTFQGLTSDGQYYIAAILPVSNPVLQETGEAIPGGDFQAFGDTFQ
ncbi:MAG: hypothetical protein OEZ02_04890, partial [Anaerolineae bacterium]|nr:hypothetical protein [Anaerolineae bacterium]